MVALEELRGERSHKTDYEDPATIGGSYFLTKEGKVERGLETNNWLRQILLHPARFLECQH